MAAIVVGDAIVVGVRFAVGLPGDVGGVAPVDEAPPPPPPPSRSGSPPGPAAPPTALAAPSCALAVPPGGPPPNFAGLELSQHPLRMRARESFLARTCFAPSCAARCAATNAMLSPPCSASLTISPPLFPTALRIPVA
eukprot:31522-Pelagococcus_subviridis.AAC.12